MTDRQFKTKFKQFLSSFDKNQKLSPSELLQRFEESRTVGTQQNADILATALKNPKYIREVVSAYKRSASGQVVVYLRKGSEPMAMTIERRDILKRTVKDAQQGVRRYWASKKA